MELARIDSIASRNFSQSVQAQQEYSASQIRGLLQQLFPTRRLVLSQFTFFNQSGVSKPTGDTTRRGRRCYRLQDILSIACVLALKEEGIPLKNIDIVPALIQKEADRIFAAGVGVRISGFGSNIRLTFPGESWEYSALEAFLDDSTNTLLFWNYDIGALAQQLVQVAAGEGEKTLRRAA